ncbi:MAG TPA: hypothetical protein VGC59_03605, partial [Solirubrobacteraceae bacterium]
MATPSEPTARRGGRGALANGSKHQFAELRARLDDLTIRDAHRLQRRLDRACRDGGDALVRVATEIAQAE